MASSGSVPSGSGVRQQQVVPRQITIEILGEEGLGSSQPVKITSFPVNTSPLKVLDFRHITMKSEVPAGSEVRIAGENNIGSLVTPAGLAKAKTQLSKVITKDVLSISKDKAVEDQRNSSLKTMTPRPILPKPSQIEGGGDDANVPVRIKQISRIGSTGISEKVNIIEVIPKTATPAYTSSYTRMSHHLSSTPSSTTASNSPAIMTTGSRRGRKKHSRRSYYAYVTESESDGEIGGGYDRRRKKRKRESDGILDERDVMIHRRSKRENMSQKLAEWGLLPSDNHNVVMHTALVQPGNKGAGAQDIDDEDGIIIPEVSLPIQEPKRLKFLEEELEPIVPGPPPKFVTVKASNHGITELKDSEFQEAVVVPEGSLADSLLASSELQPEQIVDQPIEFDSVQVKPNSVRALQQQLEDALRAEADEQLLTGSTKPNQAEMEVLNVASMQTPLISSVNVQAQVAKTTPASAPKVAGQVGGWIKKASSMLAPPLSSAHAQTPLFMPKKRVETMNKSLMCKPIMLTKATVINLSRMHRQIQTDENVIVHKKTIAVPLPCPQFIPMPGFAMSLPALAPLPVPVIFPIPVTLPASRKNVADLIHKLKELQTQATVDINPLESELLDIAEVIAETKTQEDIELENYNATIVRGVNDQNYIYPGTSLPSADRRLNGGVGSEDVAEIASDMPEDSSLTGSSNRAHLPESSRSEMGMLGAQIGRKTALPVNDTNMTLKYSYALKAWRYWAEKKNEVARNKNRFMYSTDPLRCDSKELNAGLTSFIKELAKPTGESYSPDTVLYFCLGIQYYLKENSHPDNIFFDSPYVGFTDALNELLTSYELRLNTQNMIICRVTEEHMWESSQLGCYSPQTLLNTLIYFNTKHFFLDAIQAHMNLSFSAIERSRDSQSRKLILKKAISGREIKLSSEGELKQEENLENGLRCPVKIFEFYLSKCPEQVRNHPGLFYLNPDVSAKAESQYWYTSISLSAGAVRKMLNRAKVVREVQMAKFELYA